jgi:hypothetical protein
VAESDIPKRFHGIRQADALGEAGLGIPEEP